MKLSRIWYVVASSIIVGAGLVANDSVYAMTCALFWFLVGLRLTKGIWHSEKMVAEQKEAMRMVVTSRGEEVWVRARPN
jgi:hypothetical protein